MRFFIYIFSVAVFLALSILFAITLVSSTSFANLPLPISKPDCSLAGITRVLLFVDQGSNAAAVGRSETSPTLAPITDALDKGSNIDLAVLSEIAATDLTAMLDPASSTSIAIEPYPNEAAAAEAADTASLLVNFTFGWRKVNLASNEATLGAVYSTAKRRVIGNERQTFTEPASGFNGIPSPIPFLLNGASAAVDHEAVSLALRQAVAGVAYLISQIPKDGACDVTPE